MNLKGVEFDDVVQDNKYGKWTQVCTECIDRVIEFGTLDEVPIRNLICGVKECSNEAEYYLDFNYEKTLDERRTNTSL